MRERLVRMYRPGYEVERWRRRVGVYFERSGVQCSIALLCWWRGIRVWWQKRLPLNAPCGWCGKCPVTEWQWINDKMAPCCDECWLPF